MSKTQPARGMRDFLPADVRKRNYVINVIREVYEKYGFEPLETPAVENLETLTGKYGEEGNQLMFKILKRGEKLNEQLGEFSKLGEFSESKDSENSPNSVNSPNSLADLALRYDLTVPLARVVANYKNELPKFFKRYQIQPVWRADRPARGRYREFYQCDVDAIGSTSMIVEAELIMAVSEILERLGFNDFVIRINHRKILTGILDASAIPKEKHVDALVALDKIDKIGREGVEKEFKVRGIADDSSNKLLTFFEYFIKDNSSKYFTETQKFKILEVPKFVRETEELFSKVNEMVSQKLSELESHPQNSKITTEYFSQNNYLLGAIRSFMGENSKGFEGYSDLKHLTFIAFGKKIKFDPTLARGLSYYTGAIFEINVPDLAGSLGGGGRYDGLIGMFGKEQIPACGFSLGLERILVVMEERGMFDKLIAEGKLKDDSADVMIACFDENLIGECLKLANDLRQKDLRVLVYPEASQKGKPMKYAEQIKVPFVCLLKENESAENKVTLKNMRTGEQETVSRDEVAGIIVK